MQLIADENLDDAIGELEDDVFGIMSQIAVHDSLVARGEPMNRDWYIRAQQALAFKQRSLSLLLRRKNGVVADAKSPTLRQQLHLETLHAANVRNTQKLLQRLGAGIISNRFMAVALDQLPPDVFNQLLTLVDKAST